MEQEKIDYYAKLPTQLVKYWYGDMTPETYWNEEIADIEDGTMRKRAEAYHVAFDEYAMMVGGNSLNPNMERSLFWISDELQNRGFTELESYQYTLVAAEESLQSLKEYADTLCKDDDHNEDMPPQDYGIEILERLL